MNNDSNLAYGNGMDMPLDLSFDQPLTSVTRVHICVSLCVYIIIVKVSFSITMSLYVCNVISLYSFICLFCNNLLHLSMLIICIYECLFYYHHENWHIKYKWFCG